MRNEKSMSLRKSAAGGEEKGRRADLNRERKK